MNALTRLAVFLTRVSERWVPSAFSIACLLSLSVFALALGVEDQTPASLVLHWGDGFWTLIPFAMQMCLILVTGSILADSPWVRRGLDALARLPRTPRQSVVFMAAASLGLCWLHWGLGLIASAFLARDLARRQPAADYRLLVAAAYFGLGASWHAGLSGSAPLLLATPGHFMAADYGVLPLAETTFSPLNLFLVAAVGASLVLLVHRMYPRRREDAYVLDAAALERLERELESGRAPFPAPPSAVLAWVERSWVLNGVFAGLAAAWVGLRVSAGSFSLTLDTLNFIFFAAALAAHPHPASFLRSAERAAGYVHGVILQFPLYAGMYGILKGAGLDVALGRAIISTATPGAFPVLAYWYSAALNYIIPSGGSQWVAQGPLLMEAAKGLGVPYGKTVIAFAWGDMLTNLIQPFWCLPLLAVAKLEFREVLGYLAVAFAASAAIVSAALAFA